MRTSGITSAGQQSSRCSKSVPSLRQCAGVPASMGLCKRRAKPESGPRETGRRRSNEGNRSSEGNSSASQGRHPSSCPTSPACKQPNFQPNRQSYHHSFPAAHARVAGPEQERVALRTVADSGKPLPLHPFGSAFPSTRSGCAVPCGTSLPRLALARRPPSGGRGAKAGLAFVRWLRAAPGFGVEPQYE